MDPTPLAVSLPPYCRTKLSNTEVVSPEAPPEPPVLKSSTGEVLWLYPQAKIRSPPPDGMLASDPLTQSETVQFGNCVGGKEAAGVPWAVAGDWKPNKPLFPRTMQLLRTPAVLRLMLAAAKVAVLLPERGIKL